jgi:hypothetical protein
MRPVHAAKKLIDAEHRVAAVEQLRAAALTQYAHEQHLDAALCRLSDADLAKQIGRVARFELWNAVVFASALLIFCGHSSYFAGYAAAVNSLGISGSAHQMRNFSVPRGVPG